MCFGGRDPARHHLAAKGDSAAMVDMARRYPNAWLDIHGQGVSKLQEIIEATGGERLLFGTDWPFYHMGMSLAKVLLCTARPGQTALRERILRNNALALMHTTGGQVPKPTVPP